MDRSEDQKTITRRRRVDAASAAAETRGIGAEDVAAYLRKHPDFLAERGDLLAVLTPPTLRRGESVVDMQNFMLQRLRRDLARAKTQQRALIATSRSNLTSQNRIHAAVLAILASTSFEQLLQTVTTDLAVLLDVDVVTIGVVRQRVRSCALAGPAASRCQRTRASWAALHRHAPRGQVSPRSRNRAPIVPGARHRADHCGLARPRAIGAGSVPRSARRRLRWRGLPLIRSASRLSLSRSTRLGAQFGARNRA